MAGQVIKYVASKTIAQFHGSDAMVRGLMGPIGSGKSVACCLEILTRSQRQAPNRKGERKTRWAIIRNTYPELKATTIQTWTDWIPETVCPIVYDAPIRAHMRKKLADGTIMDMEIYFLALDKPKDIKKLLSLELTGVWINEARELSKVIVTAALSRTARYPSKADCPAGITWTGLIMDTNPPDDDHWWYKAAEEGDSDLMKQVMEGLSKTDGRDYSWKFFKQPGALIAEYTGDGRLTGYRANRAAENVQHHQLGYQYWMRMTVGTDPEWVKVHCCGQYGSVFDGKPVYKDVYNDLFHVSPRPLGIFKGLPLSLGWDFGLTPACIIGQVAPNGQLRVLRELVCKRGGVKQFATNEVKPMLAQLFPGMSIHSTGDPAGNQASQADELTCLKQLGMVGLPTQAAPTNDFLPRRQAVIDRLTRTIDGQPAIVLDPSVKMIRRGFLGGYKFERVQVSAEDERFKEMPAKNKFSHPHDGLQYLVLGVDNIQVVDSTPEPPPAPSNWGGYV